jgi:hypothetical protein
MPRTHEKPAVTVMQRRANGELRQLSCWVDGDLFGLVKAQSQGERRKIGGIVSEALRLYFSRSNGRAKP